MWRLLKNLKMKLPDEPATPFPGIYPDKIIIWKDPCTPMYAAAVFSIARRGKTQRSTDDWVKMLHMFTMAIKENEMRPLAATWWT